MPDFPVAKVIALGIATVETDGGHSFYCKGTTVSSPRLFRSGAWCTLLQLEREIGINGIDDLCNFFKILHLCCRHSKADRNSWAAIAVHHI